MASRFIDTKKWQEDWYCDLKGEYQKLWDYICDHCDNAGVWKPNKIDFEIKTGFSVNLDSFFKRVNGDKERVLLLDNGRWFMPGFILFQWFNKKSEFSLYLSNRLHKSLYDILVSNNIPLSKVRGLREVLERSDKTSMEMVKDLSYNTGGVGDFSTNSLPVKKPDFQDVHALFVRNGKTEAEAKTFYNYYDGLGWMKGVTPILNWAAIANNWIANPISKAQQPAAGIKSFAAQVIANKQHNGQS